MKIKKTIEYLFYLIVFLLPWQAVWILREPFVYGEKWEYGTIGLYGIDFLILVLIGLSLVEYLFGKKQNAKSKMQNHYKLPASAGRWLIALSLLILSFLSIAWSPDKLLSLYFSFKLLLAVGLFWSVIRIKFDWRKLIVVLLLAGSIQGGLAMRQFLLQNDFSSIFLGTSQHFAEQGGSSVIETQNGRWLRAYGIFPHPNVLGGYLSVILLIVLYIEKSIVGNKVIGSRTSHKSISLKTHFLKLFLPASPAGRRLIRLFGRQVAYGLCLSGLLLSFSRSAWLVFGLGFVFLFLFRKQQRKSLIKVGFIFLAVFLIWTSAFSELFLSRANGEERLEQKSINERSEYLEQAKEVISNNLWLGIGAGNYTLAIRQENENKKEVWRYQPVHNVFLLIWSEVGIIGLILFLLFFIWIFFESYKKSKVLSVVLYVSGFVFFVVDHWLWTSHFGLLFLFFVLSLTLKFNERKNY